MRLHRTALALALPAAAGLAVACTQPAASSSPPTIIGHPIRVDATRRLLPWPRVASPFAEVAR
ncbi:MAG: hypothetical protein ACRELB_02305, partial [Polyangiaceae bacterium]